ncbi:MAG: T9SS type A sorting domain-containing protein [candidate division Zixibacteria bacterium]|nr:T9SS type A sorting domain-containing protein [candidate division Zixibacteria bacterium]
MKELMRFGSAFILLLVLLTCPGDLFSSDRDWRDVCDSEYSVERNVINSGGTITATDNYTVLSSVGEVCIGVVSSTVHYMHSGYITSFDPMIKVEDIESPTLPSQYSLSPNYPNPFNPTTVIEFSLQHSGLVTLEVFDITGRRVTTLADEHLTAGYKRVTWDGTDHYGKEVASGVYFYQLRADDFCQTRKMVLLK